MRPLAYLSDGYPCLTQTFTLREVRALAAAGFPITVFSLHRPGPSDPRLEPGRDPEVVYLPSPFSREVAAAVARQAARRPREAARIGAAIVAPHTAPFRAACQVRAPLHAAWGAYLAERLPAGAHVHAQFVGAASTVAWVAARFAGRTFSFTAHAEWGLPLVRPKLRDATFAIAISDHEKRRLLDFVAGVDESRIVVNRLGVDAPAGATLAPTQRAAGPARILAVGSLGPKKGHDVLVEACAILARRGADFRLDVVGEGPQRGDLERLVAARGLSGRVVLHGALAHARVREMTLASDVGVLACRVTRGGDVDGIPIVLMEAMAAGKATVSTTVSAIPELIEDGVSGCLVPPEDAAALADALGRLLGDETLRARLGEGARRRVRERFDAAASERRLVEIFRTALGGEPAEGAAAGRRAS